MPCRFRIVPERNLLVTICEGVLELNEVLALADAVMDNPENDDRNIFDDLSGVEGLNFDDASLRAMSSIATGYTLRRTVKGRWASYAPSEAAFRVATNFDALLPPFPMMEKEIFRTLAPALRFVAP